jgi:hypothetical protein
MGLNLNAGLVEAGEYVTRHTVRPRGAPPGRAGLETGCQAVVLTVAPKELSELLLLF